MLAYYFLYIGVGFLVLLGTIREGGASETEALAAVGFMLGWVLLGVSSLIKVVPNYRQCQRGFLSRSEFSTLLRWR